MALFQDPYLWIVLSFILFVYILWRFAKDKFLALLDKRIEGIRKEIETAESLRIEAQELLAQYQRKQRDAAQEADQIIENAQNHAKRIRKQAEAELEETMARREEQLKERLQRMEENAIQEIQAHAAALAVQATAGIIMDKLDKKTGDALLEQSIKNVSAQVN